MSTLLCLHYCVYIIVFTLLCLHYCVYIACCVYNIIYLLCLHCCAYNVVYILCLQYCLHIVFTILFTYSVYIIDPVLYLLRVQCALVMHALSLCKAVHALDASSSV